MTKDELKHIKETREDVWSDILADIAYQLTRIADQGDINDDKIRCHFRDDEWEYYQKYKREGIWTIVSLCRALVENDAPTPCGGKREIARTQPCGCIVCVCEDEERCHGCGAKSCGKDDCVFKRKALEAMPKPDSRGDALADAVEKFCDAVANVDETETISTVLVPVPAYEDLVIFLEAYRKAGV